MSHEYSVQIHKWITKEVDRVNLEIKLNDHNDPDRDNYCSGRLQELLDIRQYLSDEIDLDTHQYYQ